VNLIAREGVVDSRSQIPIEGERIVVSAMSSIIGEKFIEAVANLPQNLQPTLHIPRDNNSLNNLRLAKELGLKRVFVGVGLNTPEIESMAIELGFDSVLLDVANGYLPNVKKKVSELKRNFRKVIVGSVHTGTGYMALVEAGADVVRSGIAPGSVCTTKDVTGYTRGTFTEINALNRKKVKEGFPSEILADGGLKSSGDVVKAFLAGADYIMSGRLFVDAEEAELRVDGSNVYYGQASQKGKGTFGNTASKNIEGREEILPTDNVRPLESILTELWDGIRSGISYSGHPTLAKAIGKGMFEVKYQR
jgi:IMP dehydrogenase